MKTKEKKRRNGAVIMAELIILLGSLSYIMILAVINGSFGFICAMGVTISGAAGIAKVLGEDISLSYEAIACTAIGCGIMRGILRYFEQYSNHYIAFRLLAVLRDKIFYALREVCPAKLENRQKGAIIAMITSDIETLEVFYAHTISPICIALLVSACVVVFVGCISSWWLALTSLAGYCIIAFVLPLISSARLKEAGVEYRKEFSSFNAYFLDSIKGVKDIILMGADKEREKEVNRRSDILLKQTKKMKHETESASAATQLFVSVCILTALAVGVFLYANGIVSAGRMLISIVTVFSSFGPVIAVSALPGNLTQTFASGDRILNLLEEKPAVTPINNGQNFEFDALQVNNLCFSYDGKEQTLKDISMHVNKGEIVGIVGKSGCGKSTLLKLLIRFWQKDSGSICYNGVEIEDIDTACLLNNVTLVSQATYLFNDTIEANLRIAKPDATTEEIENACRQASIHDFIMSLPEKYKTKISVLGDNFSSGEKQRIGLARAFLRGSEILLMDEPTSNVDSINEGIILSALKAQKHTKSIILVSHRESTMSIADRVYKFKNGRLFKAD